MQSAFEMVYLFNLNYAPEILHFNKILEQLCGLPDNKCGANRLDLMTSLERIASCHKLPLPDEHHRKEHDVRHFLDSD